MPKHWFDQAESDLRVAEALMKVPKPMKDSDVGCHVAAMCSQSLEKSIKGLLVDFTKNPPRRSHRPDQELRALLRTPSSTKELRRLFNQAVRSEVSDLLALIPGAQAGKDAANTEYPWAENGNTHVPASSPYFQNRELHQKWFKLARRMYRKLRELSEVG